MSYGVDVESVLGFFGEADAIVSDAKAQLAGVALQLLDVAFARLGEAVDRGEDALGGIAVDAADISACWDGKKYLLHTCSS